MRFVAAIIALVLLGADWSVSTEDELRDAVAQSGNGDRIEVESNIVLTQPLIARGKFDVHIRGRGHKSTHLNYKGDPQGTAFAFEHCNRCILEGIHIIGAAEVGISIRTANPPGITSSQNVIRNCRVSGNPGPNIGLFIDSREWDQNNEFHLIERCTFFQCDTAAIRIWGSQAHRIVFRDCIMGGASKGLWAEYGCYVSWQDGQATNCEVDFAIGDTPNMLTIDGHRSEHSRQFISGGGRYGGYPAPVTIRNVRWAGQPDAMHRVLDLSTGPVVIENVVLQSDNGRLIRCRSVGTTTVNGLVQLYPRPGDWSQKPIASDPDNDLIEAAVQQRAFRGGRNQWIRSRYDDHAIGQQQLLERAEIAEGETLDLGSPWPESRDLLRSRTVAFKVAIDEPPDLLQLVTMDGATFKLIRERVVVHHPDMGGITWWRQDYEPGTHHVALAYDRDHYGPADKGKFWAAIDGKAGSWGGGQPLLRADQAGSLVLGGEQAIVVDDVRIWDRALSQGELERVTTE